MSDEPTQILPSDEDELVTQPTILTLMEQLRTMRELIEKRHVESQELSMSIRDDINQRGQQKYELLVNRIDVLHAATNAHFRKQEHIISALNDTVLHTRGDQRELFERITVLEEKAS